MKNRTGINAHGRTRPRRKGTARLFVLGAAFMATTGGAASAAPLPPATTATPRAEWTARSLRRSAPPETSFRVAAGRESVNQVPAGTAAIAATRIDIAPGPLADVLAAYERATGIHPTLALDSIGMIQSPGVAGVFTPMQALDALLAGTSVTYRATGTSSVVLELRQSDGVEVTARPASIESPKYLVPLRDIAQTVALIPREVIEEQGVTTLSEALRNVPGITLQAGEGGGSSNTAGDMFNMRGFNASNSLFVDGVRDDGLISRDVFNLEQVEVFMGPTGSDVGRGTAAGYVNMQTKVPHMEAAQSAIVGIGTAGRKRLSADLNVPLPSLRAEQWVKKTAVRVNAMVQDSGVPARDELQLTSRAVAPSVAFGLGTATRVTASGQFVRQENTPDYGIPGAAWLDAPLTPTTIRVDAPVRQSNYYGSPAYDYDDATQETYTARVEHDVNRRFTLRNQVRYNNTHREAVISTITNVAAFNPATNQVTVSRQGNERENTVASNQTSLAGRFATGRLRHATSLGIEYAFEQQFAPVLGGLGTRAPVDVFAPNPNDPIANYAPGRTAAFSKGHTHTIAGYAFDSVELNDRWQVSGGLRLERYDTAFRSVDAANVTTVDLTGADNLLSGKAGVLFRPAANGNIYFSYGTSVTPPGAANFTLSAQSNNQNNPSVKPQESSNLELGSKWDFAGGRLSLTGAAFHTINRNVIFTVDATAVPPIYNQDDGQRVNGVTVGVMGRLTDRWEVLANAGYLDTEQQTQNAANNGRQLTLTPPWSGSIWSTFRLPHGVSFGGGIRYTDDVFINAANTIRSPGYHLVDGLVEYAVNSHLSLRVNVYNATNERYIRNVNNNGGRYNPGNPRAATLTSSVSF